MKRYLTLMGMCMLVACSDDGSGPGGGGGTNDTYTIENAFPSLTFSRPTDVQNAGDGTSRVFVVEQTGRILWFGNSPATSIVFVFLDISSEVNYENFSELGMLGLAFHPDFENNGYFFVAYTTGTPAARIGRISRFHATANNSVGDPSSEKVLLEWSDDYANHNGGQLAFGLDGYLYIALGDEGGGGDTDDNAQDRSRIFGKILRIDVDQNVDTEPYHGIPNDNPYLGNSSGYREDIWAFGFRNPWRISFDGTTLIAGDVGQRKWEEVDIVQKGGNYGWDCREGFVAYDQNEDASSPLCDSLSVFVDPVHTYDHTVGSSITGGYVYRGPSTALGINGRYIYGDFNSGRIWALDLNTGKNTELADTDRFISTFGVAENKELYVASYFADGSPSSLYRIVKNAP